MNSFVFHVCFYTVFFVLSVCSELNILTQALAQSPALNTAPTPGPALTSGDDGSNPQTSSTSSLPQSLEGSRFLGRDLPMFNSATEIISWDGRNWNINDNRFFNARFEKFLNAPEEDAAQDHAYRQTIERILKTLAPGPDMSRQLNEALKLLPLASNYESDANLCDSLAAAVLNVWLAQRDQARLEALNQSLETERRSQFRNTEVALSSKSVRTSEGNGSRQSDASLEKDMKTAPYVTRLAEIQAQLVANRAKSELSLIQTKIEFQTLMVQFFMQRRFQHVLIAARFYQALFADGDSALKLDGDAKAFFSKTTGLPPTVTVLESLANEAIRDVREGVQAYRFLVSQKEVQSATKRLAEIFILGEFMPEMRTLKREEKRIALGFIQKSNQLLSALEVKDYALAEELLNQIEEIVSDFDGSRPRAAIETAKTVSGLHLAKAKSAAASGDRATVEAELRQATEIWPRNPALNEISSLIFTQGDVQQQALADLDRLIAQKNFRQIYEDRVRFIAATAFQPERQDQLRAILEKMARIEAAIMRANEIAKTGNHAGAWESLEETHAEFPDDTRLNETRANLTVKAPEFVASLQRAKELENAGQIGSSLSWFIKSRRLYPPSEFARQGIERLATKVLPDPEKN